MARQALTKLFQEFCLKVLKQGDIRAALYAPLRLLHYENDEGKSCLEYDRPSSIFGQFGNARINAVAVELDHKLDALVVSVTK